MKSVMENEPVMIRAFILAGLMLAVSFGLQVSDSQLQSIDAFILAGLALVFGIDARRKVSPVKENEHGE